jgi:pSer/pThr/pTyr-binding forkhead associated (FHA) protein
MSASQKALLFVPPLPPLTLPENGTVVVGRSRSCELRLSDADTSRRHAKIVCAGGQAVLHDLASTNGTRVNGELREQHVLRHGDRIQIGTNSIAFCRVESEITGAGKEGDLSDAKTHLLEEPVRVEAFQGDLSQIPPFAIVQILELGHKSGKLSIDGDMPGSLWFANGYPIHAETKGQVGFDAAIQLCHASAGHFRFEPELELPRATIQASATELLLEASRYLDEGLL